MIEFHHVTKTYPRTHTHALKDVDFRIDKGEFVYVTGHSGAGKSTLLALMLRRIVATEGTVHVAGHDVARLRESRLPALRRSIDRKSTRLNSSHVKISYAVFCLKKKKIKYPKGPSYQGTH